MSDPTKRPASRDKRTRSAKARLTPPGPDRAYDQQHVLKAARERVKSAKAIREKHEGSTKIFPRPPLRPSKERFTSIYSKDFEGTYIPPADLRPSSPTRRNNPHPGKQFMVWRVPTREIGVPTEHEGLELPPEFLAMDPNFDAIDEVGGSLDRLRLPPTKASSTEYGAYLHRLPERQRREYMSTMPEEMKPRVTKPVTSEILGRTVRGTNLGALDEWLQTASPQEQHTILKMLKNAEEAQVEETIGQVMQPGAAKAVQHWMKSADDKEREVAVRLFSSLGSRQGNRRQRSLSESSARPLSRQPMPPPVRKTAYESNPTGEKLRTRRLSAPPGARPKPWPAGLWHHLPVRDPPPRVYHRGALFGGVRGDASHYTVHPEWPDYYPNNSFSSDVVH